MSRAEMKNSGREAKRAVCYKLQGENRKGGLGWIPGETRAEARIGGSGSSSSSRGLHSTALAGCTAVSGLLSTGTGGLSAFSGLSPEANGFHPQGDHFTLPWSSSSRLPLVCGPHTDFDQCALPSCAECHLSCWVPRSKSLGLFLQARLHPRPFPGWPVLVV